MQPLPERSDLIAETTAALRRRAQRVREIADLLQGDDAEQRLRRLAEEYETRAARLRAAEAAPTH